MTSFVRAAAIRRDGPVAKRNGNQLRLSGADPQTGRSTVIKCRLLRNNRPPEAAGAAKPDNSSGPPLIRITAEGPSDDGVSPLSGRRLVLVER